MDIPSTTLKIELQKLPFELTYPNVGGFIDIEVLKAQLSQGRYDAIASTFSVSSSYAKFLIDAIATLTVMAPKVLADLKIESLEKLTMVQSKELLDVYYKTIKPWLEAWQKFLNTDATVIDAKPEATA